VTAFPEVRRHVAFRAYGAVRVVNWVQAALGDIEGAVASGQYGVAASQSRTLVLQCLSVTSLAQAGEIDWDGAAFDFFAGLPEEHVAAALSLATEAVDLDEDRATDWLRRLQQYVAATEAELGYDAPLPILRSPHGPFGIVSLVRQWSAAIEELGLPPLLPPKWIRDAD
jgi:hypothetical protein